TEQSPVHSYAGTGPYDVKVTVAGAQNEVVEDSKRVQFPDVPGSGLTAIYRDSSGNQISRIDPQIDFDWTLDAPLPGDSLDVTWTGVIVPSISGRYVLQVQTDGDAVLYLDGRTIIDKRGGNAASSDPIDLQAARRYAFILTCRNTSMIGFTQLLWQPEGMAPRIVPRAAFYPVTFRR